MGGVHLRKSGAREWLLDIIYPNVCPFCDKAIPWDIYCCDECFDEAMSLYSSKELCPVCGKEKCVCGSENVGFDRCYPAGIYEGGLRKAVLAAKFRRDRNAAVIFAEILAGRIPRGEYDIITFVPMSRRKEKHRGYNQAQYVADMLSEKLGIPVKGGLIVREYTEVAQHERTAAERRISAEQEYFPAERARLSGERVLLCDDVLTTGATMNRCSFILKGIGASYVGAAVCAVDII